MPITEVRQGPMAPDAVTLTTAMSACGRGRHWRGALHILEEIRRGSCADAVSGGINDDVYCIRHIGLPRKTFSQCVSRSCDVPRNCCFRWDIVSRK